jgi:hypothetical protein
LAEGPCERKLAAEFELREAPVSGLIRVCTWISGQAEGRGKWLEELFEAMLEGGFALQPGVEVERGEAVPDWQAVVVGGFRKGGWWSDRWRRYRRRRRR